MSNMTKIALFAAIMLSTAFSGLTAANAVYREGAGGTGMACYDRDGGLVWCAARRTAAKLLTKDEARRVANLPEHKPGRTKHA
jgi:hypothetical protein